MLIWWSSNIIIVEIIFWEIVIHFSWFYDTKDVQKHLIEIEIVCNNTILYCHTVYDQFNVLA